MKSFHWIAAIVAVVALGFMFYSTQGVEPETAKIGLVAELTGDIPAVGASSRQAAELAVAELNARGGWLIGGKRYRVQLLVEDNGGNADQTKAKVEELIKQDNVLAIIGPNASRYAIPAGEVAEAHKVVLISPWSTDPKTTITADGSAKEYVFRAAYTDPFQGRVLARFAQINLKASKAALLVDNSAEVLSGQAKFFKETFTENGGQIVAEQSFKAGDASVTSQLAAIKDSKPDIIFLPSYYNDAASVIKQAHTQGITVPFLGSDAWGSDEFLKLCGNACEGYYLTAHFSADSSSQLTKRFAGNYQALFNAPADDVAALTYDSFGLLSEAAKRAGKADRESLKSGMEKIQNFRGVTGTMQYQADSGDPVKGAVVLEIKGGKYVWHANVQP